MKLQAPWVAGARNGIASHASVDKHVEACFEVSSMTIPAFIRCTSPRPSCRKPTLYTNQECHSHELVSSSKGIVKRYTFKQESQFCRTSCPTAFFHLRGGPSVSRFLGVIRVEKHIDTSGCICCLAERRLLGMMIRAVYDEETLHVQECVLRLYLNGPDGVAGKCWQRHRKLEPACKRIA